MIANKHLRIYKGDANAAFLQEDPTHAKHDLLVEPVQELREAFQLSDEECVKIMKVAFGLVNAPMEWYEKVASDLHKMGYVAMTLEPCLWIKYNKHGEIETVIFAHVDDFVIGVPSTARRT
eukprot:8968481-Pyramimonas_sp.AAC.1